MPAQKIADTRTSVERGMTPNGVTIDTGETSELPEFQGFGVLTDGDQTNSESSADYAGFEIFK